jgi:V-type H+-transporting ATPase subunit a
LVENEITEDERKINELIDSYAQINETLETLIEKKSVFDKSSQLILSGGESGISAPVMNVDMEDGSFRSGLNFIAGIIKAEDDLRMKRMIFRTSKGRAIPTFFDLSNNVNKIINIKQHTITKKIFTIFFQDGSENVLYGKILKVLDIFGASRFNIPKREEMPAQINSLQSEISEKKNFLKQAETSIKDYIRDKTGSEEQPSKYELYRLYFKKEKLIYGNLNKCLLRGNFLDGEIWIPEDKFDVNNN